MEIIREFNSKDIDQMVDIWNEVVDNGNVFSQDTLLNFDEAKEYFTDQSFTGVVELDDEIIGLYILHPNNIGRCKHIANTSYVIKRNHRGKGIGEKLILHSMETARKYNFRILQFNAVTATNIKAIKLYKRLGFKKLGTIPGGFLNKENEYIDIIPHYIELI